MSTLVCGKNAVRQLLSSDRPVLQLLISKNAQQDEKIREIMQVAHSQGINFRSVDHRDLDNLAKGESHQGVIAYAGGRRYVEIEDILDYAQQLGEAPFILMLDNIEDPHNFGAILRSALGAGVHGIIIPNVRQVEVTPTVSRISTGAAEQMLIARVSNLAQTAERLKKEGLWVLGAHQDGAVSYEDFDYKLPLAMIIGNEGKGMSRLLKEKCDQMVYIPINPALESLNASVAAALFMFKIREKRGNPW